MRVDLNSDMGESFGRYKLGYDEELLKYVSSANIACGFHAGDPMVMEFTVKEALSRGVAIGAHPGYLDLQGFGRRSISMSPEEVEAFVLYQIGALYAFVKANGGTLRHVKPHGQLYNDANNAATRGDEGIARAIGNAVKRFDPSLILVGLSGSKMVEVWRRMGLKVAEEVFADRAYNPDGTLVSRSKPGAVIKDPDEVVKRVIRMVKYREVVAIDGSVIKNLSFDTICVHGDTPTAVELAKRIREALDREGIEVKPMEV